jgi:hypothetical protein
MAGVTANYTRSLSCAGLSFSLSSAISSDLAIPFSVSVAAAKVGALTTRTDDNTGTLTMNAGHGITDAQRLDVYWSGGSRRGMTVGTVATNEVPVDGGAGDVLPADETAVTAMVPSEEALVVTGNNAVTVAVSCPVGGTVVFATSANAEVYASVRTAAVPTSSWVSDDGGTNPLAGGSVAKVFLSHGSSAAASTISGVVQYN